MNKNNLMYCFVLVLCFFVSSCSYTDVSFKIFTPTNFHKMVTIEGTVYSSGRLDMLVSSSNGDILCENTFKLDRKKLIDVEPSQMAKINKKTQFDFILDKPFPCGEYEISFKGDYLRKETKHKDQVYQSLGTCGGAVGPDMKETSSYYKETTVTVTLDEYDYVGCQTYTLPGFGTNFTSTNKDRTLADMDEYTIIENRQ